MHLYIVDVCLYLYWGQIVYIYIYISWQIPHLYDLWNINKWMNEWMNHKANKIKTVFMKIQIKTQYIKMTSLYTSEPWLIALFTALEYTAVSCISRTLCLHHVAAELASPHSPATALVSHQALCFIKVRLSAFMLYGMWLSFNYLTHFMIPESVYILLQRDCHNVYVSEVILYFSY